MRIIVERSPVFCRVPKLFRGRRDYWLSWLGWRVGLETKAGVS